jgi:hypothetical protein
VPTREARYRFSDDVRATTRAIALRMIHAGAVAASPEELEAWIARTDDVRERLTKGGYGSRFAAGDLFPLFQGFVAKATAAKATASAAAAPRGARPGRWVWIGAIVVVAIVVIIVVARGVGF